MWTFRPVEPGDGEALCAVHRASILTLGRSSYSQAEVESWAHGLSANTDVQAMREQGHIAEVAVDVAGVVVAFCSFRGDEVMALYVHPDAAGKGLGRQLMTRAEALIAAAGHRLVRVEASASGRVFYERLGYQVIEAFDFASRGGLAMKAFRMRRVLSLPD